MNNYSQTIDCEVLIVGSGAGGSTVGETLINEGYDVLMIEDGPDTSLGESIQTSIQSFKTQWRSGGLNAAIGSPIISYAEGNCVGGGTEINSAIMQKPPENLIDEWQDKYQIQNFTYAEVSKYIEKVFDRLNASYTSPPLGDPSEILKSAGKKLNWKYEELMRAQKGNISKNPFLASSEKNAKQSMSVSLIHESKKKGLKVLPNCKLKRIVSKKKQVVSIDAILNKDSSKQLIKINPKFLFLSAGAIFTPIILRSNKLSSYAGDALQMHPTIKILARFEKEINSHKSHVPLYAITEFMPNIRIGGSNFTPGIFAMSLAEDWARRSEMIKDFKHYALYYAMVRGTGNGTVRSTPYLNEPIVKYQLSDQNWNDIFDGLNYLTQSMFAVGAQQVIPSINSHKGWRSRSHAIKEIQNQKIRRSDCFLSTVHLFSSCPIGENRRINCVGNSYGKLNNYENVYIADASIIPGSLGVNPQATVMGLSYRVADYFLNS